eukprot:jgi/Hompol1/659/HPOL_001271-RA
MVIQLHAACWTTGKPWELINIPEMVSGLDKSGAGSPPEHIEGEEQDQGHLPLGHSSNPASATETTVIKASQELADEEWDMVDDQREM